MSVVLIYMTKVAFYLAAFYLVYTLMLSSDTLHKRNRAFILLSVLSALLLPFITIKINNPANLPLFGKTLSEITVYSTGINSTGEDTGISGIKTIKIIWVLYLSGLCFFGLKMLVDIIELVFLIIMRKTGESHLIRFRGLNTSGFSALGYIFINSGLTDEEANEIIKHEQNHIDQNHFLDIIIVELMCVIQWFNPFIHLFNRSLRAVHEFQTDEVCLQTGITVCNYQKLLLNQIFKSNIFTMPNCFSSPTLIKKRMIMMTRKKSGSLTNFKLLFVIPAISAVLFAFSTEAEQQAEQMITSEDNSLSADPVIYEPDESIVSLFIQTEGTASSAPASAPLSAKSSLKAPPPLPAPQSAPHNNISKESQEAETLFEESPLMDLTTLVSETPVIHESPTEVFVVVEEMPSFPGGDAEMMNFIYKNIRYPVSAKENNVQGRVFLRFCVTSSGAVDQLSVLKGVDPTLDAEAMRVIKMLPQWSPGKQGGKPVNVWYQLPITFQLRT